MSYNPKLTNRTVMSTIKKLCEEANTTKTLRSNDALKKAEVESEMLGITILAHKLGINIGVSEDGQYNARWYKNKAEMDDWTDIMDL